MDNRKDDYYYIRKIQINLKFSTNHITGVDYDAFLNDEILQDAMMFRLIQISEESRKLSESFKAEHNSVPWSALVGLRNRIVHDYGNVDLTVVYDTLSVDIPVMKKRLQNIRF